MAANAIPPFLRIRLIFEAEQLIIPPQAIGAMWRGVLGRKLRADDPGSYQRLFEPLPRSGSDVAAANMPSPFVLDADLPPQLAVLPGDPMELDVTLIGQACRDAPNLVEAFADAVRDGLGKSRGRATLIEAGSVWTSDPEGAPHVPPVPPQPDAALIVLRTPWRGSGPPMTQKTFRTDTFAAAVIRRIRALTDAYGEGSFSAPEDKLRISSVQVWPQKLHRWSAKLNIEDDMSGTMGSFVLHLPVDPGFWAALWWAQWVHIGRKTSFGLGSLRVHPLRAG